ncbi:MAG: hypothetical protein KY450_06100 [Actinobacteria bacterium]|nr:hypothetical protein [Actinomycetota bacterium]
MHLDGVTGESASTLPTAPGNAPLPADDSTVLDRARAADSLADTGIAAPAVAAEALGLKATYPAQKALEQGRRLGHDGVAKAVALLAQADLDLRGTKGWPEELVLDVLVARLSRLSPRSRRR